MDLNPKGERMLVKAVFDYWAAQRGVRNDGVVMPLNEDSLVVRFAVASTITTGVRIHGWELAWYFSVELIHVIGDRLEAEYTKCIEILDGQT